MQMVWRFSFMQCARSFGANDAHRGVQRQPRLSTALKRPDLAEHRGTNAIRCRVVVVGQPSGNGGEDLRRLGAVVLRACGLEKSVHIGLGDVVHPRVAEHPADRIRRGTAKQAGRVRRRRGQPDLGTDTAVVDR